jgi:hypothetical protein
MKWINLTTLPRDEVTPYYAELLRRGWVWLCTTQ